MPENTERTGSGINRRQVLNALGAAGAASLAGCTGGGGDGGGDGGSTDSGGGMPSGEYTMSLRSWATDPGVKEATLSLIDVAEDNLEEMTPEGTSIDITHDPVPCCEEYNTKLKTDFGSNNPPNVFQVQPYWFGSYNGADRLADLSEYVTDEYLDQFYDKFTEPWVRDGGRYGVPKDVQVHCMYYNERMLEEAGWSEPPETWDEFHQAMSDVKENTDVTYPVVEANNNPFLWWGSKWQLDGRIMNEDKSECVIANDGNVQTMQFLRQLRDDDLLGFVNEVSSSWNGAAIGEEEAAVVFAGAWILPFLVAQYGDSTDEDIQTATLPQVSDGEEATGIYTLSYSIPAGAENPALNAATLQAIESPGGMQEWISSGVALSPFKEHRELPLYEEMPRLKTMRDDIEIAQGPVFTYGEHAEQIWNVQKQKIQAILVGDNTPREGLEAVQEKVNGDIL